MGIERVIEGRRAPQRWTANGITMEVTEMVAGSHFKLNCYAAHGNNEGNYWESPDSQWIGQSKNSYFKKRGSTQFIDWGAIKGSYPGRRFQGPLLNPEISKKLYAFYVGVMLVFQYQN